MISYRRWYDYSRARHRMLEATDSSDAPWYIVRSDDKRRKAQLHLTHRPRQGQIAETHNEGVL